MALQGIRLTQIVQEATAAATKRVLIETAKRMHAEVMRTEPRPNQVFREVDGRPGIPEEMVRDYGYIRYRYPRLDGVVQFAMEKLFEFSPVDSGEYRESHTIFINGVAVPNLKTFRSGDEIAILNPVPYARKIEVGAMTMRVPGTDHVYERAARAVKRQFKDIVYVRFTFRGVVSGVRGRGGNRIDRDTRQPVLIIKEA